MRNLYRTGAFLLGFNIIAIPGGWAIWLWLTDAISPSKLATHSSEWFGALTSFAFSVTIGICLALVVLFLSAFVGSLCLKAIERIDDSKLKWTVAGYGVMILPLIFVYLKAISVADAFAPLPTRGSTESAPIHRLPLTEGGVPSSSSIQSTVSAPPLLTNAELAAAGDEIRGLSGPLFLPESTISKMSHRLPRPGGALWPSICLVASVSDDQVRTFYENQLGPGQAHSTGWTWDTKRPGDQVPLHILVAKANFGPDAGNTVVMMMTK